MEKTVLLEVQPTGLSMRTEKLLGGAFHKKIEELSQTIRFDDDVFDKNEISDAKINDVIKNINNYQQLCEYKNVLKIHPYASSFFCNVGNSKTLFEEIYKKTGLNFNVLSEEDEIKMIYNAMIGTVEVSKGTLLYVNYHNTYVINFAKRSISSYYILPFGANNLANRFKDKNGENAGKVFEAMISFISKEIKAKNIVFDEIEDLRFVGAGPTFLSLSKFVRKLIHYPFDMDNNFLLTSEHLEKALSVLAEQNFDRNRRLANISSERLDCFMAGVAIIKAFSKVKNVDCFTIASRTIGDAIMSVKIVKEASCEGTTNDALEMSLLNNKYYYQIDESNSINVASLTSELFRQMSIIHKLTRKQLKSLKIASFMYDCGKRISIDNHAKYSRDIILNANLMNVTHKELVVAAFGCQMQNLDNFNLADWIKFKSIVDEEDLITARKIGTLISLAAALDCGKQHKIQEINCDLLGDIVVIKAITKSDASYEISEANKFASVFKKVFNKSYQIM